MNNGVAGKPYLALWPLPGGHKNFLITLHQVLQWVELNPEATVSEAIDWMRVMYNLKGPSTAPAYLETIRTMGYLEKANKKYAVTSAGEYFLRTKSTDYVLGGFINECLGAWETLNAVKELGLATLNTIHKYIEPQFPRWKSPSQPAWRVDWLLSLGCIEKVKGGYRITSYGEQALKTYKSPLNQWLTSSKPRRQIRSIASPKGPKAETSIETIRTETRTDYLSTLISEVERTAHSGDEAIEFEKALTKAFSYLGFQAEHKSGSGDTDILLTAPLGQETYRVIVDGKSSRHGRINPSAISWPALRKHWQMYEADHSLIVAPGFSAGDLYSFAKDNGAALIAVSDLCAIMRLHYETPFSLGDLREMFRYPGDPAQPIERMKARSAEIVRLQQLVSEVIKELAGIAQEPVTAEGLFYLMLRSTKSNYTRNEIRDALVLLSSPIINALREVAEGYVLQMPTATIMQRLQAQARHLESVS